MYGGKGKFVNFYETGDELFQVMNQIADKLRVRSFFALDENFLLHRQRALRLLELMEENNKSWSLYVFSSARVLKSYSIDQLIRLGISWVWMGLEGENSKYPKLSGVDTHELIREFQSHGIRVLGSTIIGMEEHTPENMDEVINYAIRHDTVFHQFMLYTPMPGTPLYEEHRREGTLLPESECPPPDVHGQLRFNYKHSNIRDGQEGEYLVEAFRRDFEVNGPSLVRMIRTTLAGYRRYKNHPNKRVSDRYRWEARLIPSTYAGLVRASKKWFERQGLETAKISAVLDEIYEEFGLKTRLVERPFEPLHSAEARKGAGTTRERLDLRAPYGLREKCQSPCRGKSGPRAYQESSARDPVGDRSTLSRNGVERAYQRLRTLVVLLVR